MFLSIILCTIYFILLDELIISSSQRRTGPYNIGCYGILSSIINGCNLVLCQYVILKVQFNYGFQYFPCLFMIATLVNYNIIYPFFYIDVTMSLLLLFLFTSLSVLFIILSAFSGSSKYCMLGCIRLITQLISYELIWTTILLIIVSSYDCSSVINYVFYLCIFNVIIFSSVVIFCCSFFLYFIICFIMLVSILAECNRTPFDLPEAESELVAGFITEYSSIYFSIILLTEYANIIVFISFSITVFCIVSISFICYLLLICLIRTSFCRLKYDELMITAWVILLPFIFILFLLLLIALILLILYYLLTVNIIPYILLLSNTL